MSSSSSGALGCPGAATADINVQTGEDDEARLREAYGASLDRLAEVKAAYDPENFFRVNRNIAPRHEALASA